MVNLRWTQLFYCTWSQHRIMWRGLLKGSCLGFSVSSEQVRMQVKSAPTMLLSRVCQPFFPSQKRNASSKKNSKLMLSCPLTKTRPSRPVNTEHMDPFSPKLACLWGTRSWQSAETWDFQRASPPRAALSGRTSSQLAQNRNVQRLRHASKNAFDIIWQLKVPQEVLKTPFVRAYQDWSSNTFEVSPASIGWSEFIPAASSMSVRHETSIVRRKTPAKSYLHMAHEWPGTGMGPWSHGKPSAMMSHDEPWWAMSHDERPRDFRSSCHDEVLPNINALW